MTQWFCCPKCQGPLVTARAGRLLRCHDCGPYPILAGIPILVPQPAAWCARHFQAAVAALAQASRLKSIDLDTLTAFARAIRDVSPEPFFDDWTLPEEGVERSNLGAGLQFLTKKTRGRTPAEWIASRLVAKTRVLEVGCGAGRLSERVASVAKRHFVLDRSLKAVLLAQTRSRKAIGCVADAAALPFKDNQVDVVVAENLVDLLDEAELFFEESARCAPRLLLTTPDPSLGRPDFDETALQRATERAGFSCSVNAPHLLWLRENHPRFVEVYSCVGYDLRRDSKI